VGKYPQEVMRVLGGKRKSVEEGGGNSIFSPSGIVSEFTDKKGGRMVKRDGKTRSGREEDASGDETTAV